MKTTERPKPRVLAVYPYRKGFGFAVLSGVDLLDWGLARIYSKNDDEMLVRVQALIDRYQVAVLATEDGSNSRRATRAHRLVERLIGYGRLRGLHSVPVSRAAAWDTFGLEAHATNHDLCVLLASYFTDLQSILPTKRRFYDPEDARTNVFRAVAIAGTAVCSDRHGN